MLTGPRQWFKRLATMRELRAMEKAGEDALVREVHLRLRDIKDAIGSKDFSRAEQMWDELRARHPRQAKEPRSTLQLLIDLKRFDEAEALAAERRKRHAHQAYDEDYAYVAHERGDYEEAARRWKAIRKKYVSWRAYSSGANTLMANRRADEAAKLLAEGINRFPEQIELRIESARLAMGAGDMEEGLRQCQAIREKYGHVVGYEGAAHCLRKLERYEEELEVLEAAVPLYPTDAGLRASLMIARKRQVDVVPTR
jgi:tetratricopeptide (TPR) repeat protein